MVSYHSFHLSVAPGDYGNLTNFRLDPFNTDVRELSFNVSIVNDSIPEDIEMFTARLTLAPADQPRLGNRVIVSPDVATVTIQDNDGKHMYFNIKSVLGSNIIIIVTILIHVLIYSLCSGYYLIMLTDDCIHISR